MNYPKICIKNKKRATCESICLRCRRDCKFAGKRRSYKKKCGGKGLNLGFSKEFWRF